MVHDALIKTFQETILLAASGMLSHPAAAVYDRLAAAAAARFPGVTVQVAVGAAAVGDRLAACAAALRPDGAHDAPRRAGFTRIAVVPLHLASGREFAALEMAVARGGLTPPHACALGRPLLADAAAARRVFAALPQSLPRPLAPDEALILVAHGSDAPRAAADYAAAAVLARRVDPRLLLGALTGAPRLVDVVAACRNSGYRRAWLLPFTVTAGSTASQAVGGDGPGTWRAGLDAAGLACTPLLRGLGELDVLTDIWIGQAEELLQRMMAGFRADNRQV